MSATHQNKFTDQLTASFGPGYATVILLAARMRKSLAANAEQLDELDVHAVGAHHAALHRLDGVHTAAREILHTTGAITDPALVERLPRDHIRTMLDHLHTDLASEPSPTH